MISYFENSRILSLEIFALNNELNILDRYKKYIGYIKKKFKCAKKTIPAVHESYISNIFLSVGTFERYISNIYLSVSSFEWYIRPDINNYICFRQPDRNANISITAGWI